MNGYKRMPYPFLCVNTLYIYVIRNGNLLLPVFPVLNAQRVNELNDLDG